MYFHWLRFFFVFATKSWELTLNAQVILMRYIEKEYVRIVNFDCMYSHDKCLFFCGEKRKTRKWTREGSKITVRKMAKNYLDWYFFTKKYQVRLYWMCVILFQNLTEKIVTKHDLNNWKVQKQYFLRFGLFNRLLWIFVFL